MVANFSFVIDLKEGFEIFATEIFATKHPGRALHRDFSELFSCSGKRIVRKLIQVKHLCIIEYKKSDFSEFL